MCEWKSSSTPIAPPPMSDRQAEIAIADGVEGADGPTNPPSPSSVSCRQRTPVGADDIGVGGNSMDDSISGTESDFSIADDAPPPQTLPVSGVARPTEGAHTRPFTNHGQGSEIGILVSPHFRFPSHGTASKGRSGIPSGQARRPSLRLGKQPSVFQAPPGGRHRVFRHRGPGQLHP